METDYGPRNILGRPAPTWLTEDGTQDRKMMPLDEFHFIDSSAKVVRTS